MYNTLKEKGVLTAQKDIRTTKPQGFIKKQTALGISTNADFCQLWMVLFNSPAILTYGESL